MLNVILFKCQNFHSLRGLREFLINNGYHWRFKIVTKSSVLAVTCIYQYQPQLITDTQLVNISHLKVVSVAVITFTSHAKGPQFEPGRKHTFLIYENSPRNFIVFRTLWRICVGKNRHLCSIVCRMQSCYACELVLFH